MACTACLVCLVSTFSGYCKNAIGKGSASNMHITKLEQSTFLQISIANIAKFESFCWRQPLAYFKASKKFQLSLYFWLKQELPKLTLWLSLQHHQQMLISLKVCWRQTLAYFRVIMMFPTSPSNIRTVCKYLLEATTLTYFKVSHENFNLV